MLKRISVFSILALSFAVNFGSAADINWNSPIAISGPSDVSTTGTLVEAFNAAADTVTNDLVLNGVTFAPTDALLPLNSASSVFLGTTGDADYDQLLANVDFGGGTDTNVSIGNGNLSVGDTYEIQLWFVDDRPAQDARVMRFDDGNGSFIDLNDQHGTGTFVATATSETINLLPQGFGNAHITAYQVRQVPEPSSLAALAAALLGLAMTSRRRR